MVSPVLAYSIVYAVDGPITYTIVALLYPYLWSYYKSTIYRLYSPIIGLYPLLLDVGGYLIQMKMCGQSV